MKTPPHAVRMMIVLISLCTVLTRADEITRPDEARLRATATKGLAYLDKEADTWMNERNCNACHHMPELLWSHREAQRHGFPTDQKMVDEFVDWSFSRTKEGPADMLALLKLAMPDKAPPELTTRILKSQQTNGSWKPGTQLTFQKRGEPDARTNTTRLSLLALSGPSVDEARAKAADFLAKSGPATCIDSLMVRALYAQRFGPPEDLVTARAEILIHQHADGGWSFMLNEAQSDPQATGEALYVLSQFPEDVPPGAVARGEAWLVGHQREDGGWDVDLRRISTNSRSGPEKAKSFKDATMIYTYWGSAWATIGVLQHFPATEAPLVAEP
ncbi:MAG TPA: hypothetical protein VGM54_20165 [Chthoniobacter sp.]|jgi:hypothetical protein